MWWTRLPCLACASRPRQMTLARIIYWACKVDAREGTLSDARALPSCPLAVNDDRDWFSSILSPFFFW
jgi:hypothetical protein